MSWMQRRKSVDVRRRALRVEFHTISTPFSTQNVVALSTGEFERNCLIRCARETRGPAETMRESGLTAKNRIWADATAAGGLAHRSGGERINTHGNDIPDWLQQMVNDRKLEVLTVKGHSNPRGLLTKHFDWRRPTLQSDLLRIQLEVDVRHAQCVSLLTSNPWNESREP